MGRAGTGPISALARRPGACVLLALASFLGAVPSQHGDLFLPWYGLVTHVALGLGSGALVLALIAPRETGKKSLTRGLLCDPLALWLGTISYGIYLWHFPVLKLIGRAVQSARNASTGTAVLAWLTVMAGGVLIGAASWYLVERPFQRVFGRRTIRGDFTGRAGRPCEIDAAVQP